MEKNVIAGFTCILIAASSTMSLAEDAIQRKPFFGELHIHTGWSFDAYAFGVRSTPDDAYNFAKGKPLTHALGDTYQLSRPLDFMAVTDHAEYLGVQARMGDPNHPLSQHELAERATSHDVSTAYAALQEIVQADSTDQPFTELREESLRREAWDGIVEAANRHYEPGKFTTFIGYEWTAMPDRQNLHRNVIFRGDDAPPPFTRMDSERPEDLWNWLDNIRAEGYEAFAIPHNSNLSDGRMFERETSDDTLFTKNYADARNRNEPLVEVTQVKGTSETHPLLSPNDEFADYEIVEQRVASTIQITQYKGSYVRDALRTGLEFHDTDGFNPYRFGLVAATDSHTGIVSEKESEYSGKIGPPDGSAEGRLNVSPNSMDRRKWSASGLAGVWAEENTRESIYDAFRRKETWGTTGPRIKVRLFGGFDMSNVDPGRDGWVDTAYAKGVPMGGALKFEAANSNAPTFVVWALKDVESANLDRVQIVKGWSTNGESHEKVYDVVWSGDRKADPATGKVPAVGNTVNLETLEYTNTIGAVELAGTWTDPDFDASQNAFYYARVLEIPTARWSMYDAKELGIAHPADLHKTIQDRAYTSPIWYDSHPKASPNVETLAKELNVTYLDRTEEQTKIFKELPIEGPVLMLNMLRFKKDGGREKYRAYGKHNAALLAEAGGKLISRSSALATLIGGEEWDEILVVEYPSREAFLDMVLSDEYEQARGMRKAALEDSRLICMQANDLKPKP